MQLYGQITSSGAGKGNCTTLFLRLFRCRGVGHRVYCSTYSYH